MLVFSKKVRIFASEKKGALAHLARALDWQSKGDEFESRMLHNQHIIYVDFFICIISIKHNTNYTIKELFNKTMN